MKCGSDVNKTRLGNEPVKRVIWILVLAMIAIAFAVWIKERDATMNALIQHERDLRNLVTENRVVSFVAGLGVYILLSLIPGTGGKAIIGGWVFGFWYGFVIVNVSLTIAAIISFLAVRYVFYDFAHQKLTRWISHIDRALDREGGSYLLTLRLLHAPYTLINYASGATNMRTRTFWWTTQAGLTPGTIAFVLAGSSLPSLKLIEENGLWSVINFQLWFLLTLAAMIPLLIRWTYRFYHQNDTSDPSEQNPIDVPLTHGPNSKKWNSVQ